MEKLIELLNEYNKNVLGRSDKWELKNSIDNPGTKYISLSSVGAWKIYLYIISKEYGFIKWLVDNDKIDRERINDRWGDMSVHFTDEELFIMSLSISSSPIEDLISYLK